MTSLNKLNTAIYKLITILIFNSLISCDKNEEFDDDNNIIKADTNAIITENGIRIDKELISQLKSKSLDTLILKSNSYILEAYMYRDFMPISPPNGKPLISFNWLVNIDSTKMPKYIDIIRQFVINNDSIWVSDYEDERGTPSTPDYKIERISRDGPKWGPKIYVDVISQVYDSISNSSYYIHVENVYIIRTD